MSGLGTQDVLGLVDQDVRYTCKQSGCGRTFARKEHLARHEHSHSESSHVCKFCQKKFTRGDSLQRHLITRHGESFKPNHAKKSTRACVACHTSKIKCDGRDQCSRCLRKGLTCKYETRHPKDQEDKSVDKTEQLIDSTSSLRPTANSIAPAPNRSKEILPDIIGETPSILFGGPPGNGPIDWSAVRIRKESQALNNDLETSRKIADDFKNPFSHPGSTQKLYLDLYFMYFHHRWPMFHSVTCDEESTASVLWSSLIMIGAWLDGTKGSRELAMNLHGSLVDFIFPRLCQITSQDTFQRSIPVELCQASLLNIIFGLYSGNVKTICRSGILRNILVGILRDVGLFKTETSMPDDKPGYFLPLKLVKQGERQRLAAYLFKIDSYLNIIHNQPANLWPSELHFSLPCTFAAWNSDGLDVWEVRHSIEPIFRSQKSIHGMILDAASDSIASAQSPMLIEDLQIAICSMQSSVWQLLQQSNSPDGARVFPDFLKKQLESLRGRIMHISLQQSDGITFTQEQHLNMRYYYGKEDHSQAGWKNIVLARVKSLIFDTLMLYHLFSLHISADVRTLTQVAKDTRRTSSDDAFMGVRAQAREQREIMTQEWTQTANARSSLWHAADILLSHKRIDSVINKISGLERNTLDPIAYVAISTSALFVWAFCIFGAQGCEVCLSDYPPHGLIAVELTAWNLSRNEAALEREKENWIETGGGCRISLDGIQLCRCNVDFLMTRFYACLPDGWELADVIAPNVFKNVNRRVRI